MIKCPKCKGSGTIYKNVGYNILEGIISLGLVTLFDGGFEKERCPVCNGKCYIKE